MSLKMCHHHGFTVSNIERSLSFYRDLLELELIRVSERKNLPSYDQIIGHDDIVLHVDRQNVVSLRERIGHHFR